MVAVLMRCLVPFEEFLELFAGGASLFFAIPKSKVETLNDADEDIANIYTQFIENYRDFQTRVNGMARSAISAKDYLRSYIDRANWHSLDPFERAWRHWYLLKTCVSSHLRRSGSTISRKKLIALNYHINLKPQHERIRGANIDCLDFRDALRLYATPKTLIYADPPYYAPSEDMYAHKMSKLDHVALAAHLHACGSNVLVSYDDVPEVRKLYAGWNMISISWSYLTSTEGPSHGTELLIANYRLNHMSITELLGREVEYLPGTEGNE